MVKNEQIIINWINNIIHYIIIYNIIQCQKSAESPLEKFLEDFYGVGHPLLHNAHPESAKI